MIPHRSLISIWLLLLALPLAAAAQENQPVTEPGGLVVQVALLSDSAPLFLSVPRPNAKRVSMWTPRFGRIAGFQPEPGTPPVRALNLAATAEGDGTRVFVSLHVGVQYFDKEIEVASVMLLEGDIAVVKELAVFGLEPIELKALRLSIPSPPQMSVSTKIASLEVIGLEPRAATLPVYTLSLRNLSNKNVAGLQVDVFEGSRLRLTSSRRGHQGLPLIPAEAVYEITLPGAKDTTTTKSGYRPDSPSFQTIVLTSLVFEDGSFEGDPSSALRMNARIAGERLQLSRTLSVLKRVLDTPGLTAPDSIATLIRDVSALTNDVPPGTADKLIDGSNTDKTKDSSASITGTIQVAMHQVKRGLLDEILAFQNSHQLAPDEGAYRNWLKDTFHRYSQWESRLQ